MAVQGALRLLAQDLNPSGLGLRPASPAQHGTNGVVGVGKVTESSWA